MKRAVVAFETAGDTSSPVAVTHDAPPLGWICGSCGREFEISCASCGALARGDHENTAADAVAANRREVIVRLLALLLAGDASAVRIGRRALLLAHLARVGGRQTQRDLAKRLGLTPGRVSQKLTALRREFAQLARLS